VVNYNLYKRMEIFVRPRLAPLLGCTSPLAILLK
jgi:hypothetical protein